MKERPAVALIIETASGYSRGVLEGTIAYLREKNDPWSIYLPEYSRAATPPGWLSRWHGQGIITRIENEETAAAVCRRRFSVVDVGALVCVPSIPSVVTDEEAAARMAAEHLLERGFKQLAFCGDPRFAWSNCRGEHFIRLVRQAGARCAVYPPKAGKQPLPLDVERAQLARWIRPLDKPIGVLACSDTKAQLLLDACRDNRIQVPDEVAVLGMDDDQLLCQLCTPPLSSVILNTHRIGYEAAALLDRMMAGKKVAAQTHLIAPLAVATRQSTEVLAIEDADLAAALRLIREHACDNLNVEDVLRVVPLSRRVLESRMYKAIGRTPHQEILRVRLDRVKRLLVETDLSLSAIARQVGFKHREYLSVMFKRVVGQSLRTFRIRYKAAGHSLEALIE